MLGGVTVREPTDRERQEHGLRPGTGVLVTNVPTPSPAASLGLQQGDVILEINQQPVRSAAEFTRLAGSLQGGVVLLVRRDHTNMFLAVQE